MKTIKAQLIQFYPKTGFAAENARRMLEIIRAGINEGCRLFCFPECSLTGYRTESAGEIALNAHSPASEDDRTVKDLAAFAAEEDVILSFGFIEKDGGKLYISHMTAGPAGAVCYRKTHLGSREEGVFTAGEDFPVYREEGLALGTCLCWETHIPEIAGIYRKLGVHILLAPYASGMNGDRCKKLWSVHLPARASDNGMYVLACNALSLPSGKAGNGLIVCDPKGGLPAGAFEPGENFLSCTLAGPLPRDAADAGAAFDMHNISYFDRRRPELYKKWLP